MKKRQWVITFFTLLLTIAGIGGTLTARAIFAPQNSLYSTGGLVIPTVAVSTSTANCDPQHIPTPDRSSMAVEGGNAIKPHLCSIPTFTKQDVRQYMSTFQRFSGFRIEQISPHFTVTRILFVTNKIANTLLNADTGVSDDTLVVCYVEVYGDFTIASPFSNNRPVLHHGQLVFDGVTGKGLVMGIVP